MSAAIYSKKPTMEAKKKIKFSLISRLKHLIIISKKINYKEKFFAITLETLFLLFRTISRNTLLSKSK